MQNHRSDVIALRPFFADLELRPTEEYIRAGRYFVDETIESLLLEWNGAIITMRESRLGPELFRSIVGVLGELRLGAIPTVAVYPTLISAMVTVYRQTSGEFFRR
jgi:hypothetical protein